MTPAVALLHGFTGAPESFRRVTELLPRAAVVAPVLGGHGPSPEASATTFEAEVDRIAALLRARGGPLHLAGYSLGGRLAIGLLARHPGLFRSATLIGAQPGLPEPSEREARRAADSRLIAVLLEQGLEAFLAEWEALPLFATQAALPGPIRDEQRALRRLHTAQGLAASLRATGLGGMPSYWDALPDVDTPTILMAGERDEKFLAIARRMAERLPRGSVVAVPGAGHNVVLERPDVVAGVIGHSLEAA